MEIAAHVGYVLHQYIVYFSSVFHIFNKVRVSRSPIHQLIQMKNQQPSKSRWVNGWTKDSQSFVSFRYVVSGPILISSQSYARLQSRLAIVEEGSSFQVIFLRASGRTKRLTLCRKVNVRDLFLTNESFKMSHHYCSVHYFQFGTHNEMKECISWHGRNLNSEIDVQHENILLILVVSWVFTVLYYSEQWSKSFPRYLHLWFGNNLV